MVEPENVVESVEELEADLTPEQKAASDELKEAEQRVAKEFDTIVIGGEVVSISRLKSGQYFKAQKVFLTIMAKAEKMLESQLELEDDSMDGLVDLLSEVPDEMIKIIAICSNKTYQEVADTAYPEEIAQAFGVVVELNRFAETIKKFAAPFTR